MDRFDVVVIGGGPGGMAAALSASRSGELRVLLVEREPVLGGILNQCTHLGFGLSYFGEELSGLEYASRFIELVGYSGIKTMTDTTVLEITKDGVITLSGPKCGYIQLEARAIILATGCRERPIGALPVAGTRPAGIFTAGAVQKMLNVGGYDIGKRAVILGSGDIGMIVARELVLRGREVLAVVEKNDVCGGLERNRINCLEKYKIPLLLGRTVGEVHGTGRVTGVTVVERESREFIECDTLITAVGLIPERELIDEMAKNGGLPDRVFLCGNACYVHDTADDVTRESERVGRWAVNFCKYAHRFVTEQPIEPKEPGDGYELGGERVLCTACPKGCSALRTERGWQGLICGRAEPVFGDASTFS